MADHIGPTGCAVQRLQSAQTEQVARGAVAGLQDEAAAVAGDGGHQPTNLRGSAAIDGDDDGSVVPVDQPSNLVDDWLDGGVPEQLGVVHEDQQVGVSAPQGNQRLWRVGGHDGHQGGQGCGRGLALARHPGHGPSAGRVCPRESPQRAGPTRAGRPDDEDPAAVARWQPTEG